MIIKKTLIIFIWIFSILFSVIWTYENPDKIEKIKNNFKKKELSKIEVVNENIIEIVAIIFMEGSGMQAAY